MYLLLLFLTGLFLVIQYGLEKTMSKHYEMEDSPLAARLLSLILPQPLSVCTMRSVDALSSLVMHKPHW